MKKKLVFANGTGAPIIVWQTGIDRFTVAYGLQIKKGLTYAEAAKETGECLFNALAGESIITPEPLTKAEIKRLEDATRATPGLMAELAESGLFTNTGKGLFTGPNTATASH